MNKFASHCSQKVFIAVVGETFARCESPGRYQEHQTDSRRDAARPLDSAQRVAEALADESKTSDGSSSSLTPGEFWPDEPALA